MEGGVTGITLLLNYAFSIPIFLSTLLINLPLFLLGWKVLGGRQIVYTGVGIGALTFFLWVFERMITAGWIIPFSTEHDFILAALYAGVTLGTGLGLVFRFGVQQVVLILSQEFWDGILAGAWGRLFWPSTLLLLALPSSTFLKKNTLHTCRSFHLITSYRFYPRRCLCRQGIYNYQ